MLSSDYGEHLLAGTNFIQRCSLSLFGLFELVLLPKEDTASKIESNSGWLVLQRCRSVSEANAAHCNQLRRRTLIRSI